MAPILTTSDPFGVKKDPPGLLNVRIQMGAEAIPLGLEQIGRKVRAAQSVVPGKRAGLVLSVGSLENGKD